MSSVLQSVNDIVKLSLKTFGLISVESKIVDGFIPPNNKIIKTESNKFGEIVEVIKQGNRDKFFKWIQNYGCNVIYEVFPETGDTLIHWTCLSGNLDTLTVLKDFHDKNEEDKVPWITLLNNRNTVLQAPLHWACTIENLSVLHFLIKEGADINSTDSKGVTPLIMACQYGNLSGATYLILNGANIFLSDFEGDNALHWALYKGHAELARLLIFCGLKSDQKDSYGQCPLHFACLSGNVNCVTDLVEKDNVEINVLDNNNKTPIILAAGRRYGIIVEYLKFHIRKRVKSLSFLNKWKYKILGSPDKNRLPMVFFLICALFWGNPYYFFVIRPSSIDYAQFTNSLFVIVQCIMWFCYIMASFKDPGYLTQNNTDYFNALNKVKLIDEYKNIKLRDYKNPINKICHSCKGVKLLRSKHCKTCDRCVEEMDHHCPYVGNCIGKRNRIWFLIFVMLMNIVNILVTYLLYIAYLKSVLLIYTVIITCILLCIGLGLGLTINFVMYKQALSNLTLIEAQKWKRYNYLQTDSGSYLNPYDQGWLFNLLFFFNIKTAKLID